MMVVSSSLPFHRFLLSFLPFPPFVRCSDNGDNDGDNSISGTGWALLKVSSCLESSSGGKGNQLLGGLKRSLRWLVAWS